MKPIQVDPEKLVETSGALLSEDGDLVPEPLKAKALHAAPENLNLNLSKPESPEKCCRSRALA